MISEYKLSQRKAHNKLWSEIWRGRIRRKALCEQCGNPPRMLQKLDAHHEDYSRPLEVQWLCRSCHAKRHGEMRRQGIRPPKLHKQAAE